MLKIENKITTDMIQAVRAELGLSNDPEALALLLAGIIMDATANQGLAPVHHEADPVRRRRIAVLDVVAFTAGHLIGGTSMFAHLPIQEQHVLISEVDKNIRLIVNKLLQNRSHAERNFHAEPPANERPC